LLGKLKAYTKQSRNNPARVLLAWENGGRWGGKKVMAWKPLVASRDHLETNKAEILARLSQCPDVKRIFEDWKSGGFCLFSWLVGRRLTHISLCLCGSAHVAGLPHVAIDFEFAGEAGVTNDLLEPHQFGYAIKGESSKTINLLPDSPFGMPQDQTMRDFVQILGRKQAVLLYYASSKLDYTILESTMKRCGLEMPQKWRPVNLYQTLIRKIWRVRGPGISPEAAREAGLFPSTRLDILIPELDLGTFNHHTAGDDCLALLALAEYVFSFMEKEKIVFVGDMEDMDDVVQEDEAVEEEVEDAEEELANGEVGEQEEGKEGGERLEDGSEDEAEEFDSATKSTSSSKCEETLRP